jgi:predicted DNA binding CopG/RHH family protein
MKKENRSNRAKTRRVIDDYDAVDTTGMIDSSKPLKFDDIGLRLPEVPPTQVISIRLPSALLNELRAISSEADIPYQALIKLFLSESISKFKKKSAA